MTQVTAIHASNPKEMADKLSRVVEGGGSGSPRSNERQVSNDEVRASWARLRAIFGGGR